MMQVLFLACIICATAQAQSNATDFVAPEAVLMAQVQQEQMISRQYVETIIKLQHAQMSIQAANYLIGSMKAEATIKSLKGDESDGYLGYAERNLADAAPFPMYDRDSYQHIIHDEEDSDVDAAPFPMYDRGNRVGQEEEDSDSLAESFLPTSYLEQASFGPPSAGAAYPYNSYNNYYNNLGMYGSPGQPNSMYSNSMGAQNVMYGSAQPVAEPQLSQPKQRLLFAYTLYYAIKLKTYQTIFKSSDVANEFWQDRAMQLYVQAAGDAVGPEVLQLLFVKMYRTNLETLKLSLSFQYISHFTTWLEDELDVYGTASEGGDWVRVGVVMKDQEDDLIRDRMFAFSSLNSFAQLDFQTFYFDLYLESVMGGGSLGASLGGGGGSSMGAAAFLEEGMEAKPFTDILATGSFGAGVATAPYLFLKVYRFYYLLFQMYAANAGLSAVSADVGAYTMANDGIAANDALGQSTANIGEKMMASYGENLLYSSQMEYVSSLFELYILAAPMVAGSLGSSLGSV